MEDLFDFQIDFDTLYTIPVMFDDVETQESDSAEETSLETFSCAAPDCDKTVKRLSIKPFCCPFEDCKKSFKRIDTLKIHLQTHKGILTDSVNDDITVKRIQKKPKRFVNKISKPKVSNEALWELKSENSTEYANPEEIFDIFKVL